MLQYSTNIYPDGATFDSAVSDEANAISFTFNGDICSGCLYKIYNYDTGEEITLTTPVIGDQFHSPIAYNGDIVSTQNMNPVKYPFSTLSAGNYVMQLQLFQYEATGNPREPLYDMFVLRGVLQENYLTTDGYVTIEDKISNIYEWYGAPDQWGYRYPSEIWGVLAGGMVIQIGSQRKKLLSYNPTTGVAYIDSAFTANIPAGTKYQIYSNYKVSPPYYFKCRTTPTATADITVETYPQLHFNVTGTYSQTQNSLINYYSVALYWGTNNTSETTWYKIDETEKIYSQQISAEFWDDFILRYPWATIEDSYRIYYKAVVTIVTVDGMTVTAEDTISCSASEAEVPATTTTLYLNDLNRADVDWEANWAKQSVRISWSPNLSGFPEGTQVQCYRENLKTGEIRMVNNMYDPTVPTKGKFRYHIVPRSTEGQTYRKGVSHADITLDLIGYTITQLELMPENYQYGTRLRYKVGDSWKFAGDVQNTTITQNTDRSLHVGYNTYPSLTLTTTNYMSGTLTAMLGFVDCVTSYGTKKYEDNIETIRAWREFITRPAIYMLKSQKGDVWIVNITDGITTAYNESIKEIPTTISFSWAECCSVDDIIILGYHQD